tara:strand:- start:5607 stop:6524 length:918 start_codon:yes stop_codon:yes gene_type:complete
VSVFFLNYVAFEIPFSDLEKAKDFYTHFGLSVERHDDVLRFYCDHQSRPSLKLFLGSEKKQLSYVSMGTSPEGLAEVKKRAEEHKVDTLESGKEYLSLQSPQGHVYKISVMEKHSPIAPESPFFINSAGQYLRLNKGALPPKSTIPDVRPRKLGHCLLFSPDVEGSIRFVEDVLGMHLSDRSGDVVAFTHCKGGSDHHVLAFAQSKGIGLHHVSFMLSTPDEVGIGGSRMKEKGHIDGWGFGRHAIGSNFFHYVRDPWGSYAEYYADIDYITDSSTWQPTDWPLEDSLHTWGPEPPEDFVSNYEA